MNRFDWVKAIGFGILIWAVAGGVLWALSATTLVQDWTHAIVALVVGAAAYVAAIYSRPEDAGQALGYGAMFVAVGMLLDALFVRPLDAHVFTTWQYYVGYGLALFAPLFRMELPSGRAMST